ncbi:P1 family peptidase [Sinorhizobium terangae]|uniref:P1 family peptidase n=1 Tax=Sinorhizobium terangae TaxID=110322 RepID=UPI0024B14842|nr:P1 family peptidase [Sinorhizobium terangae]WFU49657.1 P1 family peptidase [Sinorhizobium terangae]
MMRKGPNNLITDVAGLLVGNAEDHRLKSGVSVVLCEQPATAAVQVLGGAPGTRETDLLAPENTVQTVDALVLSGGSAFGLDAASGVQAALREMGRGFAVGPHRIPIVPAAILFDLVNGGDKNWGRFSPYRDLGYDAVRAAGTTFLTGTAGAGTGALTATFKGGLGSASTVLANGITIGALVAVNALGSATIGGTRHFWAAPFELDGEFGGLGYPVPMPQDAALPRLKFREEQAAAANTTIAVIATDAVLSKAEAKRLAIAAHDGFSRALWPSHTPLDGDLIFALATGASGKAPLLEDFIDLGAAAASTMARAIARGVHDAVAADNDTKPSWSQ